MFFKQLCYKIVVTMAVAVWFSGVAQAACNFSSMTDPVLGMVSATSSGSILVAGSRSGYGTAGNHAYFGIDTGSVNAPIRVSYTITDPAGNPAHEAPSATNTYISNDGVGPWAFNGSNFYFYPGVNTGIHYVTVSMATKYASMIKAGTYTLTVTIDCNNGQVVKTMTSAVNFSTSCSISGWAPGTLGLSNNNTTVGTTFGPTVNLTFFGTPQVNITSPIMARPSGATQIKVNDWVTATDTLGTPFSSGGNGIDSVGTINPTTLTSTDTLTISTGVNYDRSVAPGTYTTSNIVTCL